MKSFKLSWSKRGSGTVCARLYNGWNVSAQLPKGRNHYCGLWIVIELRFLIPRGSISLIRKNLLTFSLNTSAC